YRSMNIDYFFFQAEDGIRDRNVTGVQTCALPILASPNKRRSTLRPDFRSRGSSIPLAQPDFGPRGIPGWFPPRSTARWFHQQMPPSSLLTGYSTAKWGILGGVVSGLATNSTFFARQSARTLDSHLEPT